MSISIGISGSGCVLTPHVLSDGSLEWCSFNVCGVRFERLSFVLMLTCGVIYYYILYYYILYIYYYILYIVHTLLYIIHIHILLLYLILYSPSPSSHSSFPPFLFSLLSLLFLILLYSSFLLIYLPFYSTPSSSPLFQYSLPSLPSSLSQSSSSLLSLLSFYSFQSFPFPEYLSVLTYTYLYSRLILTIFPIQN